METLIFIGIAIVVAIIQSMANKAKEQQKPLPRQRNAEPAEPQSHQPPRSLQDLIRQFENAQRQATQGNIETPTPPVERRDPNQQLTLRDIAEVVIGVDFINLEFLMEEFDVDENTAAEMLMDLQAHHIVGRDMGEGDCDVLVHDIDELDNLFSHEKRAEQALPLKQVQGQGDLDSEMEDLRRKELERQRELNALEERAKSARESATAFMGNDVASGTEQAPRRAPLVSTKSLTDVRKGFIWAKVLDEPRFKRRWSAQYR
jgi:hypothetical protein